MLVTNNEKVESPKTKQRSSTLKYTIPLGFALSADCIALRALRKANRGDTFIKTAENCVRDYTVGNKKDLSFFFGKKINNISNKKMFPLIFIGGGLTNGLFIDWIVKFFKKD